jgi:hypothetical protein
MRRFDYHASKIFCGLRAGFSDYHFNTDDARKITQKYADFTGDLVSVVHTALQYESGHEMGVEVSILHNRSVSNAESRNRTTYLAALLMKGLQQKCVTAIIGSDTYVFEESDKTEIFVINGKEVRL